MAAGTLIKFLMLQVTASREPKLPRGSPPVGAKMKDIVSSEATESKVTESAEIILTEEST
jgi:hypothetical protein